MLLKGIILAAIVAAIFGSGYAAGHSQGYTAGEAHMQPVINDLKAQVDKLAKLINDERIATNKKITDITASSFKMEQDNIALNTLLDHKKTTIVTKYIEANPQTKTACGLTAPSVAAINEVLDGGIK